jgi:hypothetical protein
MFQLKGSEAGLKGGLIILFNSVFYLYVGYRPHEEGYITHSSNTDINLIQELCHKHTWNCVLLNIWVLQDAVTLAHKVNYKTWVASF